MSTAAAAEVAQRTSSAAGGDAGADACDDLNEVIAGHARTLHRLASERMMEKAAAAEVARRTSSSGAASGSTIRCGVCDYLRDQIDRCPCAGQEAGFALRHAKRPKTGCKKAATNLEAAPGRSIFTRWTAARYAARHTGALLPRRQPGGGRADRWVRVLMC